ncbi:hypothetical protein Syun_006043 [Stephania yunnanensis]|uniref:Integrase catalytic domain-containing protein n=1 Tax=Stephania yunnanensis TaxID=152371 RepID=A0AAP0KVW3_9MAGN
MNIIMTLFLICQILFVQMDQQIMCSSHESNKSDVCLADCATTHTILKSREYFSNLNLADANVQTISDISNLINGSGRANIMLPGGTTIHVDNALYSEKFRRNLLSFKDIRQNGYHIETVNVNNREFLYVTLVSNGKKEVLEKIPALSSGLYFTHIRHVETNVVLNKKINDPTTFILWHDRLGHPGSSMMRIIINNSHGHPLRSHKIFSAGDYNCASCFQGKLIVKPSPSKIVVESPVFLERIRETYVDIFILTCGPFRYFMVLIDASTRWSHVCLLSTRNVAFARLLAQIIKLRAQFPNNPIKTIRLDNVGEFRSHAFQNYCVSIGITIEHCV